MVFYYKNLLCICVNVNFILSCINSRENINTFPIFVFTKFSQFSIIHFFLNNSFKKEKRFYSTILFKEFLQINLINFYRCCLRSIAKKNSHFLF